MITLHHSDMFNTLGNIEPQSVDLLLTDFPYGTLNKKRNQWDRIIDYEKFWEHVDTICTVSYTHLRAHETREALVCSVVG